MIFCKCFSRKLLLISYFLEALSTATCCGSALKQMYISQRYHHLLGISFSDNEMGYDATIIELFQINKNYNLVLSGPVFDVYVTILGSISRINYFHFYVLVQGPLPITLYIGNSVLRGDRSLVTVGSLCLSCYMRSIR